MLLCGPAEVQAHQLRGVLVQEGPTCKGTGQAVMKHLEVASWSSHLSCESYLQLPMYPYVPLVNIISNHQKW